MKCKHCGDDDINGPGPCDCGKMGKVADAPVWTDDRAEELKDLRRLLRTLEGLNDGSSFIDKVSLCIEIAKTLLRGDMFNPRQSFVDYLEKCCIAERERFKGQKKL